MTSEQTARVETDLNAVIEGITDPAIRLELNRIVGLVSDMTYDLIVAEAAEAEG